MIPIFQIAGQTHEVGSFVGLCFFDESGKAVPVGINNPLPTIAQNPFVLVTANFIPFAGLRFACDTTAGAFTATPPASPNVGDRISFFDPKGSWGTHNLIIDFNGNLSGGTYSSLVSSAVHGSFTLTFQGSTLGWELSYDNTLFWEEASGTAGVENFLNV